MLRPVYSRVLGAHEKRPTVSQRTVRDAESRTCTARTRSSELWEPAAADVMTKIDRPSCLHRSVNSCSWQTRTCGPRVFGIISYNYFAHTRRFDREPSSSHCSDCIGIACLCVEKKNRKSHVPLSASIIINIIIKIIYYSIVIRIRKWCLRRRLAAVRSAAVVTPPRQSPFARRRDRRDWIFFNIFFFLILIHHVSLTTR